MELVNNKKNNELVWASVFVDFINKTYDTDYHLNPELAENSPVDMHAISSDSHWPHLDLQLTHAIEVPFVALNEHMNVDYSNHPTIDAIERKLVRLQEQKTDLSHLILIVQGYMNEQLAKQVFTHKAFDKFKTYPFAGIYYVSPPMISAETNEMMQDGLVVPIKDYFANKMKPLFNFDKKELTVFNKLSTPKKIQDFLNKIPANFEKTGETSLSPREVLKQNRAHCMEGAVLAATILWYHGQKPLLLDLVTTKIDDDHVVALFKQNGFWGAISKTNHAVLRFREPVYKTVRELVMSYFHEYFKDNGIKTLRKYSAPFDLSKIKDKTWLTSHESIWEINNALEDSRHYSILTKTQIKNLRLAYQIEIDAGKLVEWKRS